MIKAWQQIYNVFLSNKNNNVWDMKWILEANSERCYIARGEQRWESIETWFNYMKNSHCEWLFHPKQTNIQLCGFTRHYASLHQQQRDKCCCSGKLMLFAVRDLWKMKIFLLTTERRGLWNKRRSLLQHYSDLISSFMFWTWKGVT